MHAALVYLHAFCLSRSDFTTTSSPFIPVDFHFITSLSYYFHAVCSHEALQLAQDMATLTTGRLLFPV